MTRPLALAALLLSLAACAGEPRRYPSLAPRAVEKGSFDEPMRPTAAATPDAALDREIARQAGELATLAAGFDAAEATAEKQIAAGARASIGSEAWLDAQAAVARLDDWRSRTGALAAAIEGQGSARAATLQPPYPALDTLAARAGAEVDRQSAAVHKLQARLPAA